MPITEISPRKFQQSVQRGYDRFQNFRQARMMFLRNYVGQYYDRDNGDIGAEALNSIFNAVRVLVPNIVMNFPTHTVTSRYLQAKEYAELLELALKSHDREIKITDVYRRCIVDAVFTLGIMKTGLAESDTIVGFDEYDMIDTGTIYTEAVDFDNFVVDPSSREHMFRDAKWMGDKTIVPRSMLLESGLYNNELVEQLPKVGQETSRRKRGAHSLSSGSSKMGDEHDMYDDVEVIELWVPHTDGAALVTVPGSEHVTFEDYLRVDDYYGPQSGPYTLLSLTPPVPGNPLPVPMVGVWNDLHVLSNQMAKKIVDQATRQKDILTYRRSAADDVEEMRDAADGDAVAVDSPDDTNVISLGGQQQSNEVHLMQLQGWFNQMSGNTQAMGGEKFDTDSATEARILAQNANIGLEDMRDLVYQAAAEEASKRAWFLHTDPLIELPLIRRDQVPAQYENTPAGPRITQPAQLVDVQVYLTPEARRGDWLDFTFDIQPESMGRKDSNTRFAEAMDFAVKIMPAVLSAAQAAVMLGLPFDAKAMIIRMAKDRGIDWIEEVWFDPDFQFKMAMTAAQGPSAQQSQGAVTEGQKAPLNPLTQILQNGQPGNVMDNPSEETRTRQDEQSGANMMQSILKSM